MVVLWTQEVRVAEGAPPESRDLCREMECHRKVHQYAVHHPKYMYMLLP